MAELRSFSIINSAGEELSLMEKNTFGNTPTGLGLELTNTYYQAYGSFITDDITVKQGQFSVEMVYGAMSNKPYAQFHEAVKVLNVPPLILRYDIPDVGTYFRDIQFVSMAKSEIEEATGVLRSACVFDFTSPWYAWQDVNAYVGHYLHNQSKLMATDSGRHVYGTNLYTDTQNFNNQASWYASSYWTKTKDTYNGFAVMQTTENWNGLSQYVKVKKGDVLTYSVYAKYTSGTGTSSIYWGLNNATEGSYSSATSSIVTNDATITDSWQRVSGTAVATSDGYLRPRLERTTNNTNTLQIAGIKVEKENVATDSGPSAVYPYIYQSDFTSGTPFVRIHNDSLYMGTQDDSPMVVTVSATSYTGPVSNPSWMLYDSDGSLIQQDRYVLTIPVGYQLIVSTDWKNRFAVLHSVSGAEADQDVSTQIDPTVKGFVRAPVGESRLQLDKSTLDQIGDFMGDNIKVQLKEEWLVV